MQQCLQWLVAQTVEFANAVSFYLFKMIPRAIPDMFFKTIFRILHGCLDHESISSNLGDDAGRTDLVNQPVCFDHGFSIFKMPKIVVVAVDDNLVIWCDDLIKRSLHGLTICRGQANIINPPRFNPAKPDSLSLQI